MNKPVYSVQYVETIPPYSLKVWFADGSIKLYDMSSQLVFPCFKRLRNKAFFSIAHADRGTVVWNDDIDIAPEELYENGTPCN